MATLTLYFDVVCPYAYLAFTQAARFAEHLDVELRYRPILLGGVYKALDSPQEPARAMSPAKARLNALDMVRQADLLGVPSSWHPQHPVRTVQAMRLIVGSPEPRWPELSAALYRAYWVEHADVSDAQVLHRIARDHGVDPAVIDSAQARATLYAHTAEAVELGAFGVPTFKLDFDDGTHRFWWGADRMVDVAAALGRDWAAPSPHPRSESPRPITFFHDFASPFSYLASRQIFKMAEVEGARVERVPILVGALFQAIGTPNVPLLAMAPAKAAYLARDMRDQAERLGIPFAMPSAFPLRTVTPLRVALVEPRVTDALYRAAWAEDRDIGDAAILRAVLDEAGFDGARLIERSSEPSIKDQLRQNTARAQAQGACGVPSFAVEDQIFWGQDRLEQVRQAVRGWNGPTL